MPLTTTIDSKTGARRTFFLDASFGCRKSQPKIYSASPHWPVVEVTYVTSRYSSVRGSRKFDLREDARAFFEAKRRKKCQPEWIFHTSGTHELL